MPDTEERFWQTYGERGLQVVALDAHDDLDQIDAVKRFVDGLGVTYPVGIETSETYRALTANFSGPNPFPVNVVVGRDGRIAYVAREYDPEAMAVVIEELLDR